MSVICPQRRIGVGYAWGSCYGSSPKAVDQKEEEKGRRWHMTMDHIDPSKAFNPREPSIRLEP